MALRHFEVETGQMGASGSGRTSTIAGRVSELELLSRATEAAAHGTPAAVLVAGEAGVGKTTLVARACADARQAGFEVLWGRCVRFTAASSAYLPFSIALQSWAAETDEAFRDAVLADCPGLRRLVPSLTVGSAAEESSRLLTEVDAVVSRIAVDRPVVIVVDDLQWSDTSSLDALTYLIAGFHGQRLLLLATIRDEGLATGDPLHGWLADVRRLPGVQDLHLDRLSEEETEEQVALLTGSLSAAHPQVFARSAGNPYLTELLVRGSTEPTAGEHGVPDQLRTALLATWHRLSASSRESTRLLALAGRPLMWEEFRALASAAGQADHLLAGAITEAIEAGVVTRPRRDAHWFRHPLIADVLYETFLPGQAAPLHAAFAEVLENRSGDGPPDPLRALSDLAEHHLRAGHVDRGFEFSLRAADMARDMGARPEEAHHLSTAIGLWRRVGGDARARVGDEVELLDRAAEVVLRSGDARAAAGMLRRAVDLVDRASAPLRASRLIVRWSDAAIDAAEDSAWPAAVGRCAEAVTLTAGHPDSVEHANALAQLSIYQSWVGDLETAQRNASLALEAAARSGSARAEALGLAARAFSRLGLGGEPGARSDAEKAHILARSGSDDLLELTVEMVWYNTLVSTGELGAAMDAILEHFAPAASAGDRSAVAMLAGLGARLMVATGRFSDAARLTREGLAASPRDLSLAMVRLGAAVLAMRTGRLDEAGQHLQRVHEVFPEPELIVGLEAVPVLAEYFLARHEPDRALAVVLRGIRVAEPVDPHYADDVLLWGIRATADVQEGAADRRDPAGVADAGQAQRSLAALSRELRPAAFTAARRPSNPVTAAMDALIAAERARASGDPGETLWETAAAGCGRADLRWEQARCLWRHAQTLIGAGAPRAEVSGPLRQAHRLTAAMGAEPLRQEVAALARSARIPLAEVEVPSEQATAGAHRGNGLTAREREVLAHVVAGRTYREIAQALFISEKTVSVHVSNLLRKTGTRSRGEVASLARRRGLH